MISPKTRAGQRGQILKLLEAAGGQGVSLPEIAACAVQYNARIYELRRLGFRIANKTREVDGERHSWFVLESMPAVGKSSQTETVPEEPARSFPEFGTLAPEGRYPE